jgi:hypothetical protein
MEVTVATRSAAAKVPFGISVAHDFRHVQDVGLEFFERAGETNTILTALSIDEARQFVNLLRAAPTHGHFLVLFAVTLAVRSRSSVVPIGALSGYSVWRTGDGNRGHGAGHSLSLVDDQTHRSSGARDRAPLAIEPARKMSPRTSPGETYHRGRDIGTNLHATGHPETFSHANSRDKKTNVG